MQSIVIVINVHCRPKQTHVMLIRNEHYSDIRSKWRTDRITIARTKQEIKMLFKHTETLKI